MSSPDNELNAFANDVQQEVLLRADLEGEESLRPEAFTWMMLEALEEAGEVEEAGHAIWTVSATPLLFANGVIRYEARDFHGPEGEVELNHNIRTRILTQEHNLDLNKTIRDTLVTNDKVLQMHELGIWDYEIQAQLILTEL